MTATFDIIGEVYFASYFQESDLASYVPRNGEFILLFSRSFSKLSCEATQKKSVRLDWL